MISLMEVTVTAIGTPMMHASATLPTPGPGDPRLVLAPVGDGATTGIQLRLLSTGTFTFGTRGAAGSYRYIFATFEVRNAGTNGVAYTTPRTNLTFVAVRTPSTLGQSAVRQILRFDGSPATVSDAQNWIPTGAAFLTVSQTISALSADVLQVFTEAEVAALAPALAPGVDPFPYGFVTRHRTATNTRTLAASPSTDTYDGFVTFAFKVPLPVAQSDDPYTVRLMVVAVDDTETRVTQSVEERDAASKAAFELKATQLVGTTQVRILNGGSYGGALPVTTVCPVRVSGPVGAGITFVNGSTC